MIENIALGILVGNIMTALFWHYWKLFVNRLHGMSLLFEFLPFYYDVLK